MSRSVQISAEVSPETKELLDAFSRATGIKKARLVEDAVHQYISAMESLPPEAIVHSRVVISRDSAERVARRLESVPSPTPALRELMNPRAD